LPAGSRKGQAEAYGVDTRKIPEALAPGLANSAVLQRSTRAWSRRIPVLRDYARQVLKGLEMLHERPRA
jgi:hypothetical protein